MYLDLLSQCPAFFKPLYYSIDLDAFTSIVLLNPLYSFSDISSQFWGHCSISALSVTLAFSFLKHSVEHVSQVLPHNTRIASTFTFPRKIS